jgi:hypothetical protein
MGRSGEPGRLPPVATHDEYARCSGPPILTGPLRRTGTAALPLQLSD